MVQALTDAKYIASRATLVHSCTSRSDEVNQFVAIHEKILVLHLVQDLLDGAQRQVLRLGCQAKATATCTR